MRKLRTSGSVGGPGEQSPGSTRRAPGKLGRGGRPWKHKSETSYGTQRVINPARERLATPRKRVLRGQEATPAAKRRQRACGPCDGAPKALFLRESTR